MQCRGGDKGSYRERKFDAKRVYRCRVELYAYNAHFVIVFVKKEQGKKDNELYSFSSHVSSTTRITVSIYASPTGRLLITKYRGVLRAWEPCDIVAVMLLQTRTRGHLNFSEPLYICVFGILSFA